MSGHDETRHRDLLAHGPDRKPLSSGTAHDSPLSLTARYERLVSIICATAETLSQQTDLSPRNAVVNDTLSMFVVLMTATCPPSVVRNVLSNGRVRAIRTALLQNLYAAESEMERHFADKILHNGPVTWRTLDVFPYMANYDELTDFELAHWESVGHALDLTSHIAFVGSGPLCLTAVMLCRKVKSRITCIEMDSRAVTRSRRLIDGLGLSSKIEIVHVAGEQARYRGITHAVIAAMVANRTSILKRILTDAPRARIGIRSAEGLRTLLYTPIDRETILKLPLRYTGCSRTNERVINTLETFEPILRSFL